MQMFKSKKILRSITLAVLLICTVFIVYSILTNPLGKHNIMFALAVTAGFIALDTDNEKKNNIQV